MELACDGCQILPGVMEMSRCELMCREIDAHFQRESTAGIGESEAPVGGRNLIDHWEGWREITERRCVSEFVKKHLGASAGLVRILFFDKPPGKSWSLSLHRDKTIAVAEHHSPPDPFSKPTRKAGVPHVEATDALLRQMLTLRLHLDPMTDENGPLVISKDSHQDSTGTHERLSVIHCAAGDVFAMRPLLLHGSRAADPATQLHRRVVHLELAAEETLPAPYRWHRFITLE